MAMTGRNRSARGHIRGLTPEEQKLWGSVAGQVRPLTRAVLAAHRVEAADTHGAPSSRVANASAAVPARDPQPRSYPWPPPPLAPIDRKARQKLARGHDTIDARIDLHGRTQAQAHRALRKFLLDAHAAGHRYVLVITGKGRDQEQGILRRQVPLWLEAPDLRGLVVGFDTAHTGHGGAGALYVRVRRKRQRSTE
jgi:DNA-nicking Smr family endonuclease